MATAALCLSLNSRWKSCDSFLVTCIPPRLKQLPGAALDAALKPSTIMIHCSSNQVIRAAGSTDPSTSHSIDGYDVTAPPQPVSNYIFVKLSSDATFSKTTGGIVLPEKRLSIALQFSRNSHAAHTHH